MQRLVSYEEDVLKSEESGLNVVYLMRQYSDIDPEIVTVQKLFAWV